MGKRKQVDAYTDLVVPYVDASPYANSKTLNYWNQQRHILRDTQKGHSKQGHRLAVYQETVG
jgi:hypothetical protein